MELVDDGYKCLVEAQYKASYYGVIEYIPNEETSALMHSGEGWYYFDSYLRGDHDALLVFVKPSPDDEE